MARILSRKQEKELRTIIKEYYGNNEYAFLYSYAHQIYKIPEVRTAISTYARIFSIIPFWHIKKDKRSGTVEYIEDSTYFVLNTKPNKLQNHAQYTESWITQIMCDSEVFIEPIFSNKDGRLLYMYILPFKYPKFSVENNIAYVSFADDYKNPGKKYNMDDIIYLSRFSSVSGGAKTDLGLYETVIEALGSQIVNVAKPNKVRALLQSTITGSGQLKEKDKRGTMETVKASFDENVQGVAYLDKAWSITPVNWQENDVNRALMQFVINVVYNYFSMNEKIINFTASEIELGQFINLSGLKPLAKQYADELIAKIFTQREIEVGHAIQPDLFSLEVTTLQAKASLFSVCTRQGILNIDESREYLGQAPLPNGLGQMYRVTGDTMNLELSDELQTAKAKLGN